MEESIELRKYKAELAYLEAFTTMQGDLPVISKNKTAQYKYADFEAIVTETRPILKKYGFSVEFDLETIEDTVLIVLKVQHKLGHKTESRATIKHKSTKQLENKTDWQGFGTGITYMMRYMYVAKFAIVVKDDDTDGDSQQKATDLGITEKQYNLIGELLSKAPDPEAFEKMILKSSGVKDLNDLTLSQASTAISVLKKAVGE
jgi:hypothetical protein